MSSQKAELIDIQQNREKPKDPYQSIFQAGPSISLVLPGLYIGDIDAARNESDLNKKQITHILI
jgi:hypothetical protein